MLGTGLEPARLAARASKTRSSQWVSPRCGQLGATVSPRFNVQRAETSFRGNSGNQTAQMPSTRHGEEFPKKSGILICPKINPTGSKAFRVDIPATITGTKREQRQFPTQFQAREYATKRHSEITRFGHTAFSLSSFQRNDATRAIGLLALYGLTLEEAAKSAISHLPKLREKTTVTALRNLFLNAPGRRKTKLTKRRPHTLKSLKWRTARFERTFGTMDVSTIKTDQIKEWLSALGPLSPVSQNNFRRALHAMFSFANTEGYCASNPVTKIPLYDVPDKTPAILTIAQAVKLIDTAAETEAQLGLLGYITFGLFAGLRRAEIERLDWSAYKAERRMVTVDGSIAKTGSIRNVALSDNALEWLKLCQSKSGRVSPSNLNHRLRRLRFLAGIDKWEGNELRHSFASYHYDLHQNGPLTAAQLGHSS